MTNKELQDALNGRLEKFDGEKYTGKEASTKHTCESIEELINKKTTGVRLAGLLSRAEAIILRQRKEIAALHKAAEVEHE